MSQILDLQDKLRDTTAAIAQIASQPQSKSVSMMLRSYEKRKRQLEEEFFAIAERLGIDTCNYRFLSQPSQQTVAPLCTTLTSFQSLFTVVYDAVKTGKKKLKRILPDVQVQSSLFLGYTYAGSVGVALTFSNEQRNLLGIGSTLDETMQRTLDLFSIRTNSDVLNFGRELGQPVIRELHKWARSHVDAQFGADIQWRKGQKIMKQSTIGIAELRDLLSAIDTTTEEIQEEVELTGVLAGADVAQRRFHLLLPDNTDIKGTFGPSISDTQTFVVGRQYKANIRKKVRVYYSTDQEEDVSYQLLMATPVKE